MTYACSYEVPATIEMYREVRRLIGDETPKGLVAHLVERREAGLRHTEVWDSEDAWTRFHEERVEPAVRQVLQAAGFTEMPPDPPLESLELVDVWLGSAENSPEDGRVRWRLDRLSRRWASGWPCRCGNEAPVGAGVSAKRN